MRLVTKSVIDVCRLHKWLNEAQIKYDEKNAQNYFTKKEIFS